ncbi:hypothetical protein GS429_14295 [Natronorubrum sp. JWXQ-INN-674]|uniref:Uncharacterized protein n=1 Tax=Natronorubrum halalkaliphilum TaxID=2691917 RepID=A0A6B0VQB7_9EURY|nr:hypothetical protein [Natronorubrum halalkaliphilum]MXV63216.1 hypothetical protein [Natronorubrum halalkaliphilum]
MSERNEDGGRARTNRGAENPRRTSVDELYMMSGGSYILCSVRRPSTQWLESTTAVELAEWR